VTRDTLSHPLAIIGVLITTASAVVFSALVIAILLGWFDNPYAGLVVFVAIPACFLLGLLLIPLGVRLRRRALGRDPHAVVGWPVLDFRLTSVRRVALLTTALTAANLVIVLIAGYGTLHWMDSPTFCGQVCHAPMLPQHTAWQNGPHARIACVRCHIGEGASGFVHAKLSGVRQLLHVATNSYPRPIPPGAHMPPGAQARTCTGCHDPGLAVDDSIRVIREYADDEANTETVTMLQMHVSRGPSAPVSIHWHADPAVRVEYVATDPERQTIPYVKVTGRDGRVKEFLTPDAPIGIARDERRRTMDCVDCHSTVGHPIAPTAEKAVDQAIAATLVSRDLPYVRREGIRLLKGHYGSQEEALGAIASGLQNFYQSRGAAPDRRNLANSVAALQDVYRRNVFAAMRVTWGSYPDNLGHVVSNGCFRCHDGSHAAEDGSTISGDCEYCHKQIDNPL
jgi:hypothetical protein